MCVQITVCVVVSVCVHWRLLFIKYTANFLKFIFEVPEKNFWQLLIFLKFIFEVPKKIFGKHRQMENSLKFLDLFFKLEKK